jgi:hypothetical protein
MWFLDVAKDLWQDNLRDDSEWEDTLYNTSIDLFESTPIEKYKEEWVVGNGYHLD